MDDESVKELSKFFELTAPSLAELATSYGTLFNFRPADHDKFYNKCLLPILRRRKLTEIYDTYQMEGPVGLAANRDRNGELQYFAIEAGTIKCLHDDFSDLIERYNPNDYFLYFYEFVDVWWSIKHLDDVAVDYNELGADILTANTGFGLRGNFVKKYDI